MFAASQLPGHIVRLVLETLGPAVLAGRRILIPMGFHPAQDAFLVDGQKLIGDVNLDTVVRHFEAKPGIEQRPRSKLGGVARHRSSMSACMGAARGSWPSGQPSRNSSGTFRIRADTCRLGLPYLGPCLLLPLPLPRGRGREDVGEPEVLHDVVDRSRLRQRVDPGLTPEGRAPASRCLPAAACRGCDCTYPWESAPQMVGRTLGAYLAAVTRRGGSGKANKGDRLDERFTLAGTS